MGGNAWFESSIMLGDLFQPFQEAMAFSFFVVFILHILSARSSHSGWSVEFKTTSEANTFHGSCCTVGMKEKKLSGESLRAQLSRTLGLAGCDCSERANVGKVFFALCSVCTLLCIIFRDFRSLPSAGVSCPPRDDELSFSAQRRRDDEAGEKKNILHW